jgi:hypothetical protein
MRTMLIAVALGIVTGPEPAQAASGGGHWQLQTPWSTRCRPLAMGFKVTGGQITGNIWWLSGDAGEGPVTGTVAPDGRATIAWDIWGGGSASGWLRGRKARSFVIHQPCGAQTARGWYEGPLKADER